MTGEEQLPIGTRLRRAHPPNHPGMLGHVRGHVDGMNVIRWWRVGRQRWEYEVLWPEALKIGLWAPEAK